MNKTANLTINNHKRRVLLLTVTVTTSPSNLWYASIKEGFLIPYLREVKQLPDQHAVLGHKPFLPNSAKNIITIYLSLVSTEDFQATSKWAYMMMSM